MPSFGDLGANRPMKHPSSRRFLAYWDEQRGGERAPERGNLDPGPIREILGDSFVLACAKTTGPLFRVAGTRACALFGRDLKGDALMPLIAPNDRGDVEGMISVASDELLVAVAGLKGRDSHGSNVALELLLLPFSPRANTPANVAGILAPLTACQGRIGQMELTSFRYLAHPPRKFRPRPLRKSYPAHGLTVYEGRT